MSGLKIGASLCRVCEAWNGAQLWHMFKDFERAMLSDCRGQRINKKALQIKRNKMGI